MPKKVNKKFLEDMFSKAPQTTLGIKKILTLDTKKGIAKAVYSAKKNMCHSGSIVQGGFITGWLDAIMALACMCKVGSDVLVLSLEIKTSFIKSIKSIALDNENILIFSEGNLSSSLITITKNNKIKIIKLQNSNEVKFKKLK